MTSFREMADTQKYPEDVLRAMIDSQPESGLQTPVNNIDGKLRGEGEFIALGLRDWLGDAVNFIGRAHTDVILNFGWAAETPLEEFNHLDPEFRLAVASYTRLYTEEGISPLLRPVMRQLRYRTLRALSDAASAEFRFDQGDDGDGARYSMFGVDYYPRLSVARVFGRKDIALNAFPGQSLLPVKAALVLAYRDPKIVNESKTTS